MQPESILLPLEAVDEDAATLIVAEESFTMAEDSPEDAQE